MERQLHRLPEEGKIAGVAAGLSNYFGIDSTIIRLLFVVGAFITSGWAVIIYLVLAVVLPAKGHAGSDISERINELMYSSSADNVRNWFGIGLILIGGWYLMSYLCPELLSVTWNILGPLILVLIGLTIITKGRR